MLQLRNLAHASRKTLKDFHIPPRAVRLPVLLELPVVGKLITKFPTMNTGIVE